MAPKSKQVKTTAQDSEPKPLQAAKPQWPAMIPSIPADDLSYSVLFQDQILTIDNLWSSSLCKKYISFLSSLPLITTPVKAKRGEAVRVNDRFQIDDADFAGRLWNETALRRMIEEPLIDDQTLNDVQKEALWGGKVLGLNSNIRIYRYSKGQFFAQHYDDSNNVDYRVSQMEVVPARTTWTLLLYLSSPATGCHGGETVFYPEARSKREAAPPPVVADLEVGTVLLHRHGADCLLHEGREVTAGEKWVIRSDICVRR